MKWNAFDNVTPAIGRTKKRVLPFNLKEWFKLGLIGGLASKSGFSSSFNSGGSGNSKFSDSPENIGETMRKAIKDYWIIGAIFISFFAIISLVWSYITSVFSFIFLDAVINKEAKFTFSKNNSKGLSLFWFKLIFGLVSLLIFAGLSAPYIFYFMNGEGIIASLGWGYIVLSILLVLMVFLVIWFLLLFLPDFVTAYMYSKNVSALEAWKTTWNIIRKNKSETFIYWIARLLLGMGVGIISIFIFLILLLIFALIGLIIFLIGFLLFKLLGGLSFFIFLGIVCAIILILIFIFAILIITCPFIVFTKYFQLLSFERLTKIKILK